MSNGARHTTRTKFPNIWELKYPRAISTSPFANARVTDLEPRLLNASANTPKYVTKLFAIGYIPNNSIPRFWTRNGVRKNIVNADTAWDETLNSRFDRNLDIVLTLAYVHARSLRPS